MEAALAAMLGGLVAALIAAIELVTSKYPRTFFLLRSSGWLWSYAIIYGVIGAAVTALLDAALAAKVVTLEGIGLANPWIRASFVGLTVKAFLHIRLFTVNVGSSAVPVGVETVVQIFEPWLLRSIDLDHFNEMRDFVAPFAAGYPDVAAVKAEIAANIPSSFTKEEKAALSGDLQEAPSVSVAMEICLYYLGERTFRRVFKA